MADSKKPRRIAGLVQPVVHSFSDLVLARPAVTLLLALALGALAIHLTSGLKFDTRFSALLPEDTPELLEVNELQEKAGGTMELVIALGGGDAAARLKGGRAVADALRAKDWIRRADVEFPVDFFLDRRLLLISERKLLELQQAIDDEIERAKARANPLYVDLEDDEDEEARPWSEVDNKDALAQGSLLKETFTTPDGEYLFIRVIPMGTSYDMAAGKKLLADIRAVVSAAMPPGGGLKARYAGGLALNQEQHARMMADLKRASFIALGLILLLMTAHVRRLTAPLVIAVPLIIGVATTLGITAVTIGQLNLVSGFLVSALFGLGVDFEIHLYLRYLEELAAGGGRKAAMGRAMRRTLPACLTAATTTAAAFYAMAISDFRGFREYGLIAGTGVLVTLTVTFIALPPLAMLVDRKARARQPLWRPANIPVGVAGTLVAVGLVALGLALWVAPDVRWYNDFNKLKGISENIDFSRKVGEQIGGDFSPAGFYVEDLAQARKVEAYLRPYTKDKGSWVKQYISMASMVPQDLGRKQPIIDKIRASLQEVIDDADLEADDEKRVKDALALTKVKPWTVKDVPPVYRDQFQTRDGVGQFVIVWPRFHTDVDRDIIAWAKVLERIRKDLHARGVPVKIMDENRVAARVLGQMKADAPLVLAAAASAVFLLLMLDFRRTGRVLRVTAVLAIGMVWMLGMMRLLQIDLNVFNQAVLATIVGVGIDNVVHIQHRYMDEGRGSLGKVVSTTGSAALLASATTAIGFGAAVTAHHMGIRSLGWLSIVGLGCSFAASTIFFPALLRLLEARAGGRNEA